MGTALTTFQTPTSLGSRDIRVIQIDGNPWFVAADVCRALGMSLDGGPSRWTGSLAADEKGGGTFATPGGPQHQTTISESGLYKLILRAQRKNPSVAAFQDWVTREVLPAIRKDGAYIQGEEKLRTGELSEDEFLAKAWSILQAKLARVTAENEVLKPKADVADAIVAPRRGDNITRVVRSLDGVNTNGVKRALKDLGYLWKTANGNYRVRSEHRDRLFVEKIDPDYGVSDIMVTEAGRQELVRLWKGHKLPMKKAA